MDLLTKSSKKKFREYTKSRLETMSTERLETLLAKERKSFVLYTKSKERDCVQEVLWNNYLDKNKSVLSSRNEISRIIRLVH